jgi:molecular chaperone HscB
MSCIFCGTPFSDRANAHVCGKCGAPQPVAPGQDYFNLLGVKRGFRQDLPELETRFYVISRTLHPDRFAAGPDTKWKVISVERMSAVNRAYQTLTKADRLRDYLLELEGVAAAGEKPAIPAELAEEWFDLQDAVMDNPPEAHSKLADFENDLKRKISDLTSKIMRFETEYDSNGNGDGDGDRKEILRKIEKLVLDGQYLKSMERDLIKLKTRLGI